MLRIHDNSGFTLLELLISIAILGIIMIGLQQALGTAISSYDNTKEKQDLLAQARFAMERMVMFVQETGSIDVSDPEILKVSERVLDTYINATHVYDIDGDGILDADNDSDGLVNENILWPDPKEWITFDVDKTEGGNWKLQERMPKYSTGLLWDYMGKQVICEHVTIFNCSLLPSKLVEIELTLNNGKSEVNLKTRARARLIE